MSDETSQEVFQVPPSLHLMISTNRPEFKTLVIREINDGAIKVGKPLTRELVKLVASCMEEIDGLKKELNENKERVRKFDIQVGLIRNVVNGATTRQLMEFIDDHEGLIDG
jgi:hypothetical protein